MNLFGSGSIPLGHLLFTTLQACSWVSSQDIMTADEVTLRLNAVMTYKVLDARKAISRTDVFGRHRTAHRTAQRSSCCARSSVPANLIPS